MVGSQTGHLWGFLVVFNLLVDCPDYQLQDSERGFIIVMELSAKALNLWGWGRKGGGLQRRIRFSVEKITF